VVASIGVVVGTAIGTRALDRMQGRTFHRVVGVALLVLGAWMALGGGT
jgi:uncharacterized membrane protein YfcA